MQDLSVLRGIRKKRGLDYKIIGKGALVNSFIIIDEYDLFSTSDKLEIGGVPFISHNAKPTRAEALEYYRRVSSHWDLDLKLYEEILSIQKQHLAFDIQTSKGRYTSKNIIVATGFYDRPFLLDIPGEELDKVKHYYSEPHPYFGMDLVVVGAANSAVDVALETYRKGAKA